MQGAFKKVLTHNYSPQLSPKTTVEIRYNSITQNCCRLRWAPLGMHCPRGLGTAILFSVPQVI